MGVIRNLFALIGLVVVIAGVALYVKGKETMDQFDPEAPYVYYDMFKKVVETKSAADATVWKVPVAEGVSAEDVEQAMKFVANELNISNVGTDLPLSKDIEGRTGKPYRFVKIYLFCNSLTAAQMLDYNDAYSAYLPCRITLLEDKQGKLWLVSLNMDLMIYGGEPLPPELKQEALRVKETILEIMRRGAEGDF
jgi:uncharacterized protein (DUF302 family)